MNDKPASLRRQVIQRKLREAWRVGGSRATVLQMFAAAFGKQEAEKGEKGAWSQT